jgi:hypothetical protein
VRFEIAEGDDRRLPARGGLPQREPAPTSLSLQHEYGIFGGPAGSHVLTLLRELRMPMVTTLHTILAAPTRAAGRHGRAPAASRSAWS